MLLIRVILALFGLGLGITGYREIRLSRVAHDPPRTVTCRELASTGPGENAYVLLTDYEVPEDTTYAGQQDKKGQKARSWLPAVPKGSGSAAGFRVLIQTDWTPVRLTVTPRKDGDRTRYESEEVTLPDAVEREAPLLGTIVNEVEGVPPDVKKLLRSEYPGVDFDKAWILDLALDEPRSLWRGVGNVALGVGVIALVVVWWRRARRRRRLEEEGLA